MQSWLDTLFWVHAPSLRSPRAGRAVSEARQYRDDGALSVGFLSRRDRAIALSGNGKAARHECGRREPSGAGGAIGYKHVLGQKPDGYNLVWNSNSISTTYHSGQLAADYKAFDPVARVLVESPLLVVRAEARWKHWPT